MRKKSILGGWIAGAAAVMTVLTGAGAAHALPLTGPTPNEGPIAGGTVVTVEIPGAPTWQAIETGRDHVLALGSDGLLYTGDVHGTGAYLQAPTPAGVTFSSISTGTYLNTALATDGTVYSWSAGNAPTVVTLPPGVTGVQVSAGRNFQSVLGSDGRVYGWGTNAEGALGDGTSTSRTTPVEALLPPGEQITQISAGGEHVLALSTNGTVWGWGNDASHALASTDPSRNKRTPVEIEMPQTAGAITQVTATIGDGSGTSFFLDENGVAYAAGKNMSGAAGTGTSGDVTDVTPLDSTNGPAGGFTEIVGGEDNGAAIGADGALYVWGASPADLGTLGAPTNRPERANMPAAVTSLTQLQTGISSIVARSDDGTFLVWGKGGSGEASEIVPLEGVVDSVDFGGTPGTSVTRVGGARWSATTPAHTTGTFNVTVNWSLGGLTQTPIVYQDGFSFIGAPVVVALSDASVRAGETAVFSLSMSGYPQPSVTWEVGIPAVTRAATIDWQPISADPNASVSADGTVLRVATTAGHDGRQYRATATNSEGAVTSNAARLTILPADPNNGGSGNGGSGNGGAGNGSGNSGTGSNGSGQGLAQTGGEQFGWLALAAGAAVVLGAGALVIRRRA